MDIEIRQILLSDLETIKDYLISDFDDFWNYNILKEELISENSKYIVAILNKTEIVGVAGIKIIFDEADIMNIVTKKTYRNVGIGSSLLERLIIISKNLKLSSITLEVNEENIPAIHMYKKFGFKSLGIRKNYYKDKNGIIMTKNLMDKQF